MIKKMEKQKNKNQSLEEEIFAYAETLDIKERLVIVAFCNLAKEKLTDIIMNQKFDITGNQTLVNISLPNPFQGIAIEEILLKYIVEEHGQQNILTSYQYLDGEISICSDVTQAILELEAEVNKDIEELEDALSIKIS